MEVLLQKLSEAAGHTAVLTFFATCLGLFIAYLQYYVSAKERRNRIEKLQSEFSKFKQQADAVIAQAKQAEVAAREALRVAYEGFASREKIIAELHAEVANLNRQLAEQKGSGHD